MIAKFDSIKQVSDFHIVFDHSDSADHPASTDCRLFMDLPNIAAHQCGQ